ncbi:MAG: hypothetical protein ACLQPD_03395 [Desulfomonilaceae bacterium]
MARRVNLSGGRYRKLEWYERNYFITLVWRHAKDAARGELMLELQDTMDLSKTFLVYKGNLTFNDVAALARKGGLNSIKNEDDWRKWD